MVLRFQQVLYVTIILAGSDYKSDNHERLRNQIFPTLYAIYQQTRGQKKEFKIKNRTLWSLTRSCLYHKQESQLLRTLEDSEALFEKCCKAPPIYNEQGNTNPLRVDSTAPSGRGRRRLPRLQHSHELAECWQ